MPSVGRPALLVGAAYALVLVLLLATHDWDARFFATLGPQWLRHDPAGRKAMDGMIFYAIAEKPFDNAVGSAYRQERILYPLLAHVVALGRPAVIPWALVLLSFVAIVVGTEIVHRLLLAAGAPGWIALAYGAWAGLGLAMLKDTAEPVTYMCALLGIWWLGRGQGVLGYSACLAALLGRETAALLVGPYLFLADPRRAWWRRLLPGLLVLGLWQLWIFGVRVKLQSSLVPEWWRWLMPLRGLLHIDRLPDLLFAVVFLVIPALVTLVLVARGLWRTPLDPALWAALLNVALVLFLPTRSTALVWHSARISTGLVASVALANASPRVWPRAWRWLAAWFVLSSVWTAAVVVRYLFWDVVEIPGGR
jgi:hypothetical protein